jgi:hypothetical protein
MTIANVANQFMSNMRGVSPAMSAAKGYRAGQILGQRDTELENRKRALDMAEDKAWEEKQERLSKLAGEELEAHQRENFGVALSALSTKDPQTALIGLQKSGRLDPEMTVDDLPIFMAQNDVDGKLPQVVKNLQAQAMGEKKFERSKFESDRDYELAKRKQRTTETKADRIKSSDSNTIGNLIKESGNVAGEWDSISGKWVIEDAEERKRVLGVQTRAEKLFSDNPDMSHAEAVTKAMREAGINVTTATGQTAPAFNSGQPVRAYDPQSRTLR